MQGRELGCLGKGVKRSKVSWEADGSNLECAHFGEPTFFVFFSEAQDTQCFGNTLADAVLLATLEEAGELRVVFRFRVH